MSGPVDAADLLRDHGPLSAGQVQFLVNAVASDVDARVAAGKPHGRLNPTALWLEPSGGVRLTDALDEVDAHAHAAPEVLAGQDPTVRSEVFSLASTTYTLLTGHPPNPYGFATVRRARPDLGPKVDSVLAQATARGPEFRFDSAAEYAASLATALESFEQPIVVAPVAAAASPDAPAARVTTGSATGMGGRRFRIPDAALPIIFMVLVLVLAVEYVMLFVISA